ncbi:MAG TPA: hypothetical protein VIH81_01165, partial [Roseiarcus sp.]
LRALNIEATVEHDVGNLIVGWDDFHIHAHNRPASAYRATSVRTHHDGLATIVELGFAGAISRAQGAAR